MADTRPRLLTIKSPLPGDDALIPTRLVVTEQLGQPYSIEVDVLGSDAALKPSQLLTQPVTVTVTQRVNEQPVERHFHGLVAAFERLGPGASQREAYRLVAVPGIWRLGLKRNCRIFQDKTARQIVDAILGEHDQPAPKWGIVPSLQPLPYCTQFNETDLAFVSRLLEEHGMTYYFSHAANAHTLHVSATAPGFPAHPGDVVASHGKPGFFDLRDWRRASRARPAGVELEDMDTECVQPSVVQKKRKSTRVYADEPSMWAPGTVFRWPGGMARRPGVDNAAVAMGGLETASEEYGASASDPRFAAGARVNVSIEEEGARREPKPYVVTAVGHEAVDWSKLRSGADATESYAAAVQLVDGARDWMPAERHPRPVMAGLYSAEVTGPSGEKIHVDEFGRIKVKFRWDRLARKDDTSSCWVRVAQSAAGAWGGTWFLPRVGDEVMVAFLDGDPDRPVVAGSVYGKDAKPPFQPAANRAQSGIRTRSYKSDSADDANILRFEDKKGSEEVLLHAQKDLKIEVENDETRTVDHDQTTTVKNARTTTIKQSHDTLTIETGNRTETIKKGNDALTVEMGNETHTIKMGNLTMKCELGSITLEAMQKITLKVGQNTVVIDQMGITAKGMMITEEAQVLHKTKAPMLQENADAMVQVQGGIVMIN
jgi:type VI secretion system secreted protein VgrG